MAGSELQPGMLELLGTSRSLSPPHTQLLLLFFFFFPTVWICSRRPELPPAPGRWGWHFFSPFARREWLCSSLLRGLELRGCSKGWGAEIGLAGPAQILDIVGWGWCRGTGTRESPAVLQPPLPGQGLCVCQERGQ